MDQRPLPSPELARGPRLHHDSLAMRPVFVAPQRAERPDDTHGAAGGPDPRNTCPFCAGNEGRTPPDILRAPADAALPWRARIVANAYPFVAPQTSGGPLAAERPAHGVHDVVIESASHERSILALDAADWRDVWLLCHRRLAALAHRDDIAWATVFKNSGPRAGASLEHVHSQLVGLDFVPPAVTTELKSSREARDPFAELIMAARAAGRVVAEIDGVVALVPPAPRQPFETWLLPAAAAPHFHAAPVQHVAAVAALTRWFVSRLGRLAPGGDYNWWLHQAPHAAAAVPPRWHWHLEILPRLAQLAGFELGTGCHVSTLGADEAARRLREA